jgi:hypothetical protein
LAGLADGAIVALVAVVLGLFVGPALLRLRPDSKDWRNRMNVLVLVLVAGLVVFHVGPHALEHGAGWTVLGMLLGGGVPSLLSRLESLWVWGSLALLSLHTALDGAALSVLEQSLTLSVTFAMVAHRLPVGMAVALRARTPGMAVAVLSLLSATTVLGFFLGATAAGTLSEPMHGLLEGLIVGGLFHVVSHRAEDHEAHAITASAAPPGAASPPSTDPRSP